MSKYIYTLNDYHAIKKAEISIDGITVISGINGVGKSTLSKWLYYIVNGVHDFEKNIYDEYIENLLDLISRYSRARRDISRGGMYGSAGEIFMKSRFMLRQLGYEGLQDGQEDKAFDIFKNVLDGFCDMLAKYLTNSPSRGVRERLLKYLDVDDTEEDFDDDERISIFHKTNMEIAEHYREEYQRKKERRNAEDFFDVVKLKFNVDEKIPNTIQLREDGAKIFEKGKVKSLFNLNEAIYVDTPMAVSMSDAYRDNKEWDNLRKLMLKDDVGVVLTDNAKKILFNIKKILHGEVKVEKDDFNDDELHYVREDGLDIKIEDVATGFKAFSYIQRLIANGRMNKETLLLIDEPEAHLHPQWIVEFARLLVRLNKLLDVKIMMASHNPDMVAAIRAIAQKEGVLDTTLFYLAQPTESCYQYEYKCLGNNIEEIFASFNIAYRRIEEYGTSI